jgi:hypothetical protein
MSGVSSYPRTRGTYVPPEVIRAFLDDGFISEEDIKSYRAEILSAPSSGQYLIKEIVQVALRDRRNDATFLDKVNARLLQTHSVSSIPVTVYHHTGARNLTGVSYRRVEYTRKSDRALYRTERLEFDRKIRSDWLRDIGKDRSQELLAAGLSQQDINRMCAIGKAPDGYQVHHRIPLDDGGTNDSSNFILIKDNVEHRAMHGYYNPAELRIRLLADGETAVVALPVPPEDTLIYPNPAMGYVSESVGYSVFLEMFDEH